MIYLWLTEVTALWTRCPSSVVPHQPWELAKFHRGDGREKTPSLPWFGFSHIWILWLAEKPWALKYCTSSSCPLVISCCFAFTREQGSLMIMFLKCLFFITVDTSPCSLFRSRTLLYVPPCWHLALLSFPPQNTSLCPAQALPRRVLCLAAALSFAPSLLMVPLWNTTGSWGWSFIYVIVWLQK